MEYNISNISAFLLNAGGGGSYRGDFILILSDIIRISSKTALTNYLRCGLMWYQILYFKELEMTWNIVCDSSCDLKGAGPAAGSAAA
jgi:hypothetical protein